MENCCFLSVKMTTAEWQHTWLHSVTLLPPVSPDEQQQRCSLVRVHTPTEQLSRTGSEGSSLRLVGGTDTLSSAQLARCGVWDVTRAEHGLSSWILTQGTSPPYTRCSLIMMQNNGMECKNSISYNRLCKYLISETSCNIHMN